MQQQWTISQSDWDVQQKVDFIQQPAQWLDHEAPKYFPKPNSHQKRPWSLFSGLLPIWSTTAFWIPAKPLSEKYVQQIDDMHWKLQRLHSTLVNRTGPIIFHDNAWPRHITKLQKLNNYATKLCLIRHIHLTSHQLSTTSLSISTTFFAEKMLP